MTVPSEELRAVLLRFYAVLEQQDADSLWGMFSSDGNTLLVGTDAEEWMTGSHAADGFVAQMREMPGFTMTASEPIGYRNGNVGWVADRPTISLPTGVTVSTRLTAVLTLERGQWKFVQWHMSLPYENESTLGHEFITNIDRIEQAVRDDRPDVGRASAPDGTVTIVFTDIEDSTVLLDRLGDTEFLRLLGWHDEIVRHVAEQHRGFVVKSQGDGFMLAFPSAASALRATLIMRERIAAGYSDLTVRVRAGLHAGEAIARADDFYGRTVVIAARVSALALGGEILASDLVFGLTRGVGTFTFGAPRVVPLKGLVGNIEVYPVLA